MTIDIAAPRLNSPRQVLFASLVGTTIEFFDFYIYGTAAVLVFPILFFPASNPATATLASLATFGIAFVARPIGSALFGHFGDRIGRKTALVAALLTMGLSTVSIGLLPTYETIGVAAPGLLALCRFGQRLGLGGEWGGAVLLAVENAPPHKRAWYGMLPQLGRERMPMLVVLREYGTTVAIGTLVSLATFVIFYLMTVFTLSWGTAELGFTREQFLLIQLVGVACFAVLIPVSARLAEGGRRRVMIGATLAIIGFGPVMAPLFVSGTTGAVLTLAFGLGLMGLTYGPLGTVLSELFPTTVRYTGSSLTFNLAGIFGASLAPYIATWLANHYGLQYVGYYLSAAGCLPLAGLLAARETKDDDLHRH